MLSGLFSLPAFIIYILVFCCTPEALGFTMNPDFTFAVTRLPDGASLRDPASLDVSLESGDILVADTGNDQIRIFNRYGVLMKSIGRLAGIRSPIGVAFAQNGDILITEMGSPHIKRLDSSGRLLSPILINTLAGPALVPGRILAFDRKIFVADRAAPRILILSGFERVTRQIEQEKNDGESAWKVQDIAVDGRDNIYVLSSQGLAVHVFDRDGVHQRSFGAHGPKEEEFSFPTGVAIGPQGNVWITDSFRQEIKIFDTQGRFLFRWGVTGSGDGTLFYPIDVAFGQRTLYVLEKGASRLQAFDISGP